MGRSCRQETYGGAGGLRAACGPGRGPRPCALPPLPSARFMPASAAQRGSAGPLPASRRFCFRRQSASSAAAAEPDEDEPEAVQRSCSKATGSVRFLIPRPTGPAADGVRGPRPPARAAVAATRRSSCCPEPAAPHIPAPGLGARLYGPAPGTRSAAPANQRRAPTGPAPSMLPPGARPASPAPTCPHFGEGRAKPHTPCTQYDSVDRKPLGRQN